MKSKFNNIKFPNGSEIPFHRNCKCEIEYVGAKIDKKDLEVINKPLKVSGKLELKLEKYVFVIKGIH